MGCYIVLYSAMLFVGMILAVCVAVIILVYCDDANIVLSGKVFAASAAIVALAFLTPSALISLVVLANM